MWSAIKSDLFEFVNTVKADASKAVTKVLGEEDEQDDDVSSTQKRIIDLRRSYMTYSEALDETHKKSYDTWRKSFSLTNNATEIAQVLDDEADVSRFYAELVPSHITAEEFWARFFFKQFLITKGSAVNLVEDEDDEDIAWDCSEAIGHEDKETSNAPDDTTESQYNKAKISKNSNEDADKSAVLLVALQEENVSLKINEKKLMKRISELENELSSKTSELEFCLLKINVLGKEQTVPSTAVSSTVTHEHNNTILTESTQEINIENNNIITPINATRVNDTSTANSTSTSDADVVSPLSPSITTSTSNGQMSTPQDPMKKMKSTNSSKTKKSDVVRKAQRVKQVTSPNPSLDIEDATSIPLSDVTVDNTIATDNTTQGSDSTSTSTPSGDTVVQQQSDKKPPISLGLDSEEEEWDTTWT
eukprot:gene12469-26230_t